MRGSLTAAGTLVGGLLLASCGDVIGPDTYGEPTGIAWVEGGVTVPDTFRVGVPDTVVVPLGLGGCERFLEFTTVELGVHERLVTPWFETDTEARVCHDSLLFEPNSVVVTFHSTGPAKVYVRGRTISDIVRDFEFDTVVTP